MGKYSQMTQNSHPEHAVSSYNSISSRQVQQSKTKGQRHNWWQYKWTSKGEENSIISFSDQGPVSRDTIHRAKW